jgi:hypothetical protein
MLTHEEEEQLRAIIKRHEKYIGIPPQSREFAQLAAAVLAMAQRLEQDQERTDLE